MKKILTFILSFVFAFAAVPLFACAKENPETTLYIDISNAGYGIDWLNPLKDIFEEENEGFTVKIRSITKGDAEYVSKLLSGTADTDLFFVETDLSRYLNTPVFTPDRTKYDSGFEDLTTFFEEKIPGEEKSIAEKMDDTYLEYCTVDGKNYFMPWVASMQGILINNKVYREEFGKLPNTTDELIEFCETVRDYAGAEVTPFIFSLNDSYWEDIYSIWMYQYNGLKEMKKFNEGYAINEDFYGERYVPEMFLDEGLYAALDVLDELLKTENKFQHRLGYTLSFTEMQNAFLETENNILMCPNGAWIEREMNANYTPDELDIRFIRTPVVSALGDKLGINDPVTGDDTVLSALIDCVDAELAGEEFTLPEFESSTGYTDEEVYSAVKEARLLITANHYHAAFIPAYGQKKDMAKKFLHLLASDRGIEAMLSVNGAKPPFEYDISSSPVKDRVSDFMLSVQEMIQTSEFYFMRKDKLFTLGGLNLVNGISSVSKVFAAENKNIDYMDAEELYMENYLYVSGERWDTYLKTAGIETID